MEKVREREKERERITERNGLITRLCVIERKRPKGEKRDERNELWLERY